MPTVPTDQAIPTVSALGAPTEWSQTVQEPYCAYAGPSKSAHTAWFEDGWGEPCKIRLVQGTRFGGVGAPADAWRLSRHASWNVLARYGTARGTLAPCPEVFHHRPSVFCVPGTAGHARRRRPFSQAPAT